jgi:hypothetical protein
MNKNFNKVTAVISSLCILLLPLTGCAPARKNTNPDNITQQGQNLVRQNMQATPNASPVRNLINTVLPSPSPLTTPVPSPGIAKLDMKLSPELALDRQRAENLKNKLYSDMGNNLKLTNVIVNNDTAIIGYTANGVKGTGPTQNTISDKVKQLDRSIKNCIVTDSKDAINKINQLQNDINNNKPAKEITDKFNQLANSIKAAGR